MGNDCIYLLRNLVTYCFWMLVVCVSFLAVENVSNAELGELLGLELIGSAR